MLIDSHKVISHRLLSAIPEEVKKPTFLGFDAHLVKRLKIPQSPGGRTKNLFYLHSGKRIALRVWVVILVSNLGIVPVFM